MPIFVVSPALISPVVVKVLKTSRLILWTGAEVIYVLRKLLYLHDEIQSTIGWAIFVSFPLALRRDGMLVTTP